MTPSGSIVPAPGSISSGNRSASGSLIGRAKRGANSPVSIVVASTGVTGGGTSRTGSSTTAGCKITGSAITPASSPGILSVGRSGLVRTDPMTIDRDVVSVEIDGVVEAMTVVVAVVPAVVALESPA